ncbi:hypothetical protein D2E26_1399 [Bifidobacterium dolichotidis]|uniref:Uncharacterized protein n=1 Tax=Bifidobacterium dolichotidis TaxID=2306976 RepID=A0A430FKJ5_9BIFI|nr:hypothetical protein [Bifidobacterium dolichotidis]RSX53357.1 hypothetical protein D2E26_1399 [Bifidobacterium dolichotidis]
MNSPEHNFPPNMSAPTSNKSGRAQGAQVAKHKPWIGKVVVALAVLIVAAICVSLSCGVFNDCPKREATVEITSTNAPATGGARSGRASGHSGSARAHTATPQSDNQPSQTRASADLNAVPTSASQSTVATNLQGKW